MTAIVFAERYKPYFGLEPDDVLKTTGITAKVIDAFGILTDEKICRYL
jgi:hypothetical protein